MKMLDEYPAYTYLFSLFLVTYFLYKWLTITKTRSKNPPPSPPQLPIIGNLHQIGPDLHLSLRSLAQKYGPLMQLKFGNVAVLVVSSADAAREVMKTHDLAFSDRPFSSVSNRLFYNSRDVAFARYSEYWRQMKSACVSQLLSSSRVNSYSKIREEEVGCLIQKIEYSESKIVNLSELFGQTTSSVICRVALGRKYGGDGKEKNIYKKVHDEIARLLGRGNCTGDYFPLLFWVDWLKGLTGMVEKTAKEADNFLEDALRDHQSASAPDNGANKDFVSILLELQKTNAGFDIDNDCIKAIILDMVLAGTGTTATTMEWALAALLKYPDVMSKLQEEVRAIGKGKPNIAESDLVNMHYLKAVMKESMRFNLGTPLLMPRETRQDVKVMGYDIRSGTQVLVNAWAIARDPCSWENPEEFQPERFLNSQIDYKGLHYEFLPFGSGRRVCPGIKFGMSVNELAVANLVHKFDFELPDGKKKEDLDMSGAIGLTVGRKYPLLVIATPYF